MKTPQKPIPETSKLLQINNEVWFKFENKHQLGSHKGRSIPVMIQEYIKNGNNSFVISSSGNAALAAIRYVNSHNKNKPNNTIKLQVLVGLKINKPKLDALQNEITEQITISQVENPKQVALSISKNTGAILLRGSTDDLALIGYGALSEELLKIPNLSAVFIASSSGTSAQGIYEGFKKLNVIPEIHIVQTEYCHPLADYYYGKINYNNSVTNTESSLADAIVDKIGRRKEKIIDVLSNSNGFAWVVNDNEIREAIQILSNVTNENISGNGGLKKALNTKRNWPGAIVCIIGGN